MLRILTVVGCIAGAMFCAWPQVAKAQDTPFCGPGQKLENGFCVRITGAQAPCPNGYGPVNFGPAQGFACVGFSTAGAQAQTISATSRGLAEQSSYEALDAVRLRREEETQRCPDGTPRINGVCRQAMSRAIGYSSELESSYVASTSGGRMVVKAAPAPGAVAQGAKPAMWIQVYGDREWRNETTPSIVPTSNGVPGTIAGTGLSTSTSLSRTTNTGGVLGGIDVTFLNITGSSDAFVIGLLGGFSQSRVTFSNSTNITDVSGPSAGLMAAYVRGAFSVDATFKADFMRQEQQFSDFSGGAFAVTGQSVVEYRSYSTSGNFNYRFPIANNLYFEPTIGAVYVVTDYVNGAALGLIDSTSTRLQGGARIGDAFNWGSVVVSTTLTGLAYSTVQITGGSVQQAGLAGITPSDQGKVFGQFLAVTNFDFGKGFSASLAGDVRFASNVAGVGAKAGLRYQW